MKSSLLKLHISVFLWGFTGVLGRLILLNEGLLVWYRLLFTISTLGIILWYKNQLDKLSKETIFKLFKIGCIIALHWVFFYGSIKYSNVSISLTCISAGGFFTAFLEPIMMKKKIAITEVLLGLLAIAGIYLIFHFETKFQLGISLGIIASLLSVIFSIYNKKLVHSVPPLSVILFELTGGWLLLSALMPFYLYIFPAKTVLPSLQDGIWLLILSWICTIVAMYLSLEALKKISVFTQNLTLNLEPVYGIILAMILFKENKELSPSFYIGLSLIIATVIIQILLPKTKKVH